MDSYAVGEDTLASQLISSFQPGMLCMADRGLTGHPLFKAAAASGADLLWRAKSNTVLPDGSFISELAAGTDKHRREDVIPVRVIEYSIGDQGRPAAGTATGWSTSSPKVLCDHPAHTRIRRAAMAIGRMPGRRLRGLRQGHRHWYAAACGRGASRVADLLG